jgi:hypothetical protein
MVAANNNIASLIHQKPSVDSDQRYLSESKKGSKKKKKPLYEEFCWTDNEPGSDSSEHDFRDVADGLTVVAGMLEVNHLNPQMGKRPLFSPTDSGRLIRMMVAVNRLMTGVHDLEIDATRSKARLAASAR